MNSPKAAFFCGTNWVRLVFVGPGRPGPDRAGQAGAGEAQEAADAVPGQQGLPGAGGAPRGAHLHHQVRPLATSSL